MKLRNNFKYSVEFYKLSVSSPKFILVLMLSIIIAFYGVIQPAFGTSYSVGFIRILTNTSYIICLLLIILLNTKNTYEVFESNQFFIMRFGTRKKYLDELIKTICFSNFCTIILNLGLVMIGLNIFNPNQIVLKQEVFTIQSNYYIVFVAAKLVLLTLLISMINILFFKRFNNAIVIIFNFILYILIATFSKSYMTINSITQLPLFIGDYYLINFYNSFIFEICIFLFYISCLYLIITFFKKNVLMKMKDVGK